MPRTWIDSHPFPWTNKDAVAFSEKVCERFAKVEQIEQVMGELGLPLYNFNIAQAPRYVWHDILNSLAGRGEVQKLVDIMNKPPSKPVTIVRKIEYKSVQEKHVGLMQKLEALGLEGWEAFSILKHDYTGSTELPYYTAYLKRPKE